MKVSKKSTFSGKYHTMEIEVTQEQLDAWQGGMLIQDAMPDLSPAEREFLLTGTTQEEWDAAFGGDNE